MKEINFVKMQGIGNDYVYVNLIAENLPDETVFLSNLSEKIADRHFGVGGDGLIVIAPSKIAPFKMRMFNADGSEAEMCGNGLRCFAKYLYDDKLVETTEFDVETGAGVLRVAVFPNENDKIDAVRIKMSRPKYKNAFVPVKRDSEETIQFPLQIEGREFLINCVNVGNPHCVIILDKTVDLSSFDVEKYGKPIENHEFFPERTNVEFVKVTSKNEVFQRTWERGSGETLACGTGATAVFAIGRKLKLLSDIAVIHLLGGDLELSYDEKIDEIFMKGPAVTVFSGKYLFEMPIN